MADQSAQDQRVHPRIIAWPVFLVAVLVAGFMVLRTTSGAPRLKVALVTADQTEYWDLVVDGAKKAAEDFNLELTVAQATGQLQDQNKQISGLAATGLDGIAVSPVDSKRQAPMLQTLGLDMTLVTLDSDSPESGRVCFVGADNYSSGRMSAELVQEKLPEGGRVLIVCGPLDKENGRQRREGFLDELLARETVVDRELDPIDTELSSGTFTVPYTLVDPLDAEVATAQIAEALQNGEKFDAIVGLYGYHAGAIAAAVADAGGESPPIVIGFDATPSTLDAIENGQVDAVIAQDQFAYGYNALRLLADVARGDKQGLPMNGVMNLAPTRVTPDTISFYRTRQNQ